MCDWRHAALGLTLCFAAIDTAAGERLPDPTRPPIGHQAALRRLAQDAPAQFRVTAIKIGESERKAIINDRLLNEGDRLGEAVVVEIAPGRVTLDYLSERQTISLLPFEVRRVQKTGLPEE